MGILQERAVYIYSDKNVDACLEHQSSIILQFNLRYYWGTMSKTDTSTYMRYTLDWFGHSSKSTNTRYEDIHVCWEGEYEKSNTSKEYEIRNSNFYSWNVLHVSGLIKFFCAMLFKVFGGRPLNKYIFQRQLYFSISCTIQ